MSTAAVPPHPATRPDASSMIALFDRDGVILVAVPYAGDDPPGALAVMLARWQGVGSCISGGSVFDQEGHTLARAQI